MLKLNIMDKEIILNTLKVLATVLLIIILLYSNVGTVKIILVLMIGVLVSLNLMGFKLHYEEEEE